MSAFRLRPAEPNDADLLLGWANAPDSLAAKMQTSSAIPRSTHVDWLARRLADSEARIRIILDGDAEIGQVRLEPREGALEIDVYVVPDRRGRGVAHAALSCVFAEVGAGSVLRARARAANAASRRLFASLGFRETAVQADHVVFERDAVEMEKP